MRLKYLYFFRIIVCCTLLLNFCFYAQTKKDKLITNYSNSDVIKINPYSQFSNSSQISQINILDSLVVVIEYESIWDVHVPPDTINYPNIRAQPAFFYTDKILSDLEEKINPSDYDFVLLYSLREVPAWINSGFRWGVPAKNIGLWNNGAAPNSRGVSNWKELRSAPHMNSLEFLTRGEGEPGIMPNYGSTLTAFHEMGHYWGVYINPECTGLGEWTPELPLAYLAASCNHWSWMWSDSLHPGMMPGLLFSGMLSTKFNAYDLYFMGLMSYAEASRYSYEIYSVSEPNYTPKDYYTIQLDSLIYAISLRGSDFCEGDGKRIPDIDSTVVKLKTLIVVVKGQDDIFTQDEKDIVLKLAKDIPKDWSTATWGRSNMSVSIDLKPLTDVKEFTNCTPKEYTISQNFPNPFNPTTNISYSISQSSKVSIIVYDVVGRIITTLVNEEKSIGSYSIEFDGSNLSSGMYFYQMKVNDFVETKKMLLLK